jgi:hypothetical protein
MSGEPIPGSAGVIVSTTMPSMGGFSRARIVWRSSRALTVRSMVALLPRGLPALMAARAYSSVWSRPGTTRISHSWIRMALVFLTPQSRPSPERGRRAGLAGPAAEASGNLIDVHRQQIRPH